MARRPNILVLVWDACRYDSAREHADTLGTLADENRWFERAVTPAPWSLPAHASLFSGEYPHEHGRTRLGDGLDGLPLAPRLSGEGYTCYGVSANGFACQRTGFHGGFDEFHYTRGRERFDEGLDVSGTALGHLWDHEGGRVRPALRTARDLLTHDHPLKSLVNAGAVGLGSLGVRSDALGRLPHPLFAADSGYVYDPAANTARLREIFEREAETDGPFFAFANYMDTHRPYSPDGPKQRRHLGRELDRAEIRRLNDEVAAPWPFLAADARGDVSEADVEAVRGLYAGEVETVDDHLARLLDALAATGQREDTLIVVTSDHGENLGAADERGQRLMGHEASVGDALARVPLVIAHPDVEAGRVERPFSLCDLFDLLTDEREAFLDAGGDPARVTGDTVVSCQYPAAGGEQLRERYPEVPAGPLDYRIDEHAVAVYDERWRVGMDTTGDRWARSSDGSTAFGDAPEDLVESCDRYLDALRALRGAAEPLEADAVSRLEALGYM